MKRIIWGVAAVAIVAVAWSALAQEQSSGPSDSQDVTVERRIIRRGSDQTAAVRAAFQKLSESQQADIRTVQRQHKRQQIRLTADLRIAAMDLQEATESTSTTDAEIRRLSERVTVLRGQLAQARTDLQLNIRNVVGPDEWAKWQSRRGQRGRAGMGRRSGGRQGFGLRQGSSGTPRGQGMMPRQSWQGSRGVAPAQPANPRGGGMQRFNMQRFHEDMNRMGNRMQQWWSRRQSQ